MFGRIRSSPSPLHFEFNRSKLFKDDSLSIYEATLVKLKQGSERSMSVVENNISSSWPDSMDFEPSVNGLEDSSSVVTSSCCEQGMPISSSSSSSSCISTSPSSSPIQDDHKNGKVVSIQVLFSRYNNSSQYGKDRVLSGENGSGMSSEGSCGGCSSVTQSSSVLL